MLFKKGDEWDIQQLQWSKELKRVLIQKKEALDGTVSDVLEIVAVRADDNWWYPTSETEEDFISVKKLFDNCLFIVIYGNAVFNKMPECNGESELWIDVDDTTDGTCNTEEYEPDEIYVPTSGTDKANIDKQYQFLKPPCFCFYNKPMEDDNMEHRAERYEVIEVMKEKGTDCQVRFKFAEWKGKYEQIVDIKDVEFLDDLGMEALSQRVKLLQERKPVDRYNPDEEDIKNQEYKDLLKTVKQENEMLKKILQMQEKYVKISLHKNQNLECLCTSLEKV